MTSIGKFLLAVALFASVAQAESSSKAKKSNFGGWNVGVEAGVASTGVEAAPAVDLGSATSDKAESAGEEKAASE